MSLDSLDGTLFIHSLNSFHRTSMFVDIEFVSRTIVHRADTDSFIDIILALGHRYYFVSWSLMPATVEQCDTNETLFVRNTSRMFSPLLEN